MNKRQAHMGFTLLEMVVVVVILGILAAGVAQFIRAPIDAYTNTANRAALSDAADGAIRRMGRDIQRALPNSFRPPSNGDTACFELLPTEASGRYRVERDSSNDANDNTLDFSTADSSFDVLAHVGLNQLSGSNSVVVYNLGIAGANAYAAAENRQSIQTSGVTFPATGGAVAKITLTTPTIQFPNESPSRRFYVIGSQAVVYSCSGGAIWRALRAISPTALATCPTTGDHKLVGNVDCTRTSFTYVPAVTQRAGMVELIVTLVSPGNGESVRLYDRVSVNNAP